MIELVEYHEGHKEKLIKLIGNLNVSKWLTMVPHPYTEEDADFWIKLSREKSNGMLTQFAVENDGEYIGGIGLHPDTLKPGVKPYKSEVGYWLGEPYWGKGYASKALQKILEYAFDELNMVRVFAHTFVGNEKSELLLKRNGFEFEGLLRKAHMKDGKLYDSKLYAKVI